MLAVEVLRDDLLVDELAVAAAQMAAQDLQRFEAVDKVDVLVVGAHGRDGLQGFLVALVDVLDGCLVRDEKGRPVLLGPLAFRVLDGQDRRVVGERAEDVHGAFPVGAFADHVEDDDGLGALDVVFEDDSRIFGSVQIAVLLPLRGYVKDQGEVEHLAVPCDVVVVQRLPVLIEHLTPQETHLGHGSCSRWAEYHSSHRQIDPAPGARRWSPKAGPRTTRRCPSP